MLKASFCLTAALSGSCRRLVRAGPPVDASTATEDRECGTSVPEVQRKSGSQAQDPAGQSSRRDDPAKRSRRLEGKRQQTEVAGAREAKRGGDGEIRGRQAGQTDLFPNEPR